MTNYDVSGSYSETNVQLLPLPDDEELGARHCTMSIWSQTSDWIHELVGCVLLEDLIDVYGAVVLPKDTLVTANHIQKMQLHPIAHRPASQRCDYATAIQDAIVQLDAIFDVARQRHQIQLAVAQSIVPTVHILVRQGDISSLLQQLQVKDNYTVSHSFAVSVLSTLIGKWMHLDRETLSSLTLAAMLHDIGKVNVSDAVLNKPGSLTNFEYQEVQRHTVFGYDLIKRAGNVHEELALVALQHHERMDGTGYPYGVKGEEITLFSRIVGVADVFHAMSSKRVYHDARPMYEILDEMHSGRFGLYDASIIQLFLTRMMESLIGSEVILSNGQVGKIVMIHALDPTRPIIQAQNVFIDLHANESLRILQVGPR